MEYSSSLRETAGEFAFQFVFLSFQVVDVCAVLEPGGLQSLEDAQVYVGVVRLQTFTLQGDDLAPPASWPGVGLTLVALTPNARRSRSWTPPVSVTRFVRRRRATIWDLVGVWHELNPQARRPRTSPTQGMAHVDGLEPPHLLTGVAACVSCGSGAFGDVHKSRDEGDQRGQQ